MHAALNFAVRKKKSLLLTKSKAQPFLPGVTLPIPPLPIRTAAITAQLLSDRNATSEDRRRAAGATFSGSSEHVDV